MEYLNRSRLPVFTPRLDLTAEDLNAQAETLCAAINELAGRLYIIKDMIPAEQRSQYAEEESYPILDEINRIWDDIQRAWETIAQNKEECEAHYQETLAMIQDLESRLNTLIENVRIELLATIDAVDTKHDNEEGRIESKFDTEMTDLETRFNALDDAAARKSDVAALLDRIQYIQDNSIPRIGTDGYWYIGKIKTNTLAQGPQGPQGIQGPQGVQGPQGEPAKINGNNVINIVAGQDVTLQQSGNNFRIDCNLRPDVGSTIDASLNSTNYVLTLKLKNSAGTVLSTSTIDLPIESVVVSGRYDSQSKTIILELVGGGTIAIPVGGLVSGLQAEITSQNKLDSDLVDDTNSTNKFVSSSDKTAWNSKYDKPLGGIPSVDLDSSVQASLGKADTAIQDVSDKQSIIQYASLPTASQDYVGKVFQYIGTTNNTYVQGSFYICIENNNTYSWQQVEGPILPTKTSDLINDSGFINGLFIATYGTTSYEDVKAAVDANKIVYCYVPNNGRYAFLAYNGGNSYEFQYYRSNSNSHTSSSGRDSLFVYKITKNGGTSTWTTTERKTEAFYQAGDNINFNVNNNTEVVTINADIQKVSTMPTAGSTYTNKIYQYIGTTDTNYTQGFFYICNDSSGSYAWHQIDVQPSSSGQADNIVYLNLPALAAYETEISASAEDQAIIENLLADNPTSDELRKYIIINIDNDIQDTRTTSKSGWSNIYLFQLYAYSATTVYFKTNSFIIVERNSNDNDKYEVYRARNSIEYNRTTHKYTNTGYKSVLASYINGDKTSRKLETLLQYSTMPTASYLNEGQLVLYTGETDATYTKGETYKCVHENSTYSWKNVDFSKSNIFQYVSTSSSTDYGKNSTNAINLNNLKKGTHVFKNTSNYNGSLYLKYYPQGTYSEPSSTAQTSTISFPRSYSTSRYSKFFIIEMLEEIEKLGSCTDGVTAVLITVFFTDGTSAKYQYTLYNHISGYLNNDGLISDTCSQTQLSNVYSTASSASSTASQAANQASTNASAITALDTRVTALEQGGGGGGGSSQTEYISDGGGTPYPPSYMWSTSSYNYFNFAKNTAEFKEGSNEYISVTLTPDQRYNDKINVNMGYSYMSAMTDTSDVTIPNVTFKLYSTNDDSELSSINVGDVTLTYDSMSNKWSFNKYDIPFTYIMSGQDVYCKMFYGNGSSDSGLSITEILTNVTNGSSDEYFLDINKIYNLCKDKTVRFNIVPQELKALNIGRIYIRDDSDYHYQLGIDYRSVGFLDIICCDELMSQGMSPMSAYYLGILHANSDMLNLDTYKIFVSWDISQGYINRSSLWYLKWTSSQ